MLGDVAPLAAERREGEPGHLVEEILVDPEPDDEVGRNRAGAARLGFAGFSRVGSTTLP